MVISVKWKKVSSERGYEVLLGWRVEILDTVASDGLAGKVT